MITELFILGVVSTALISLILFISWLLRPIVYREEARQPIECGMPAEGNARNIGFNYMGYATLFLIFDLAALYLFLYSRIRNPSLPVTLTIGGGIAILFIIILYGSQKRKYYVA